MGHEFAGELLLQGQSGIIYCLSRQNCSGPSETIGRHLLRVVCAAMATDVFRTGASHAIEPGDVAWGSNSFGQNDAFR